MRPFASSFLEFQQLDFFCFLLRVRSCDAIAEAHSCFLSEADKKMGVKFWFSISKLPSPSFLSDLLALEYKQGRRTDGVTRLRLFEDFR